MSHDHTFIERIHVQLNILTFVKLSTDFTSLTKSQKRSDAPVVDPLKSRTVKNYFVIRCKFGQEGKTPMDSWSKLDYFS